MRRSWILIAILALVAAACSGANAADETTTTSQAPTTTEARTATTEATTTTTEAPAGPVVTVAESALGSILVDGEGNTLYLFTPDEQGASVCYDQCETAWPPLVGDIQPGDGPDATLLGSAPRTDGTQQATYNGWPLYYFANDATPGDTNGQGVNDVWYVLDTQGEAIGLEG